MPNEHFDEFAIGRSFGAPKAFSGTPCRLGLFNVGAIAGEPIVYKTVPICPVLQNLIQGHEIRGLASFRQAKKKQLGWSVHVSAGSPNRQKSRWESPRLSVGVRVRSWRWLSLSHIPKSRSISDSVGIDGCSGRAAKRQG